MASDPAAPAVPTEPVSIPELTARASGELEQLDRELEEIDLLITQASTEAERHEQKRAAAAEKAAGGGGDASQLVTLTRRATLMQAQVEVLEGKRKALGRYRDSLGRLSDDLATVDPIAGLAGDGGERGGLPPPTSRAVLVAQEELRREIARAMHDGPAQSLTNIVLQAQIVERLVGKDPEAARGEVRQLISMVQQTLDATKSFIFDVRPMVLDDLGLVPTLRRAARERGARAGIPVEFDSTGQDRRLSMEVESAVYRMLDEALAAYLAGNPDRVVLRLDWSDRLEGRVNAVRHVSAAAAGSVAEPDAEPSPGDLPPALAAMVEEQRAVRRAAAEARRVAAIVVLPPEPWREIQQRAATIGAIVELAAEGSELRIAIDLPGTDATA